MNGAYLIENFSRAKRGTKPPGQPRVYLCSFSSGVYQQGQRWETGTFFQAILYREAKVRLLECWIKPLLGFNQEIWFSKSPEMKMSWPYSITYMIWLPPSCPISFQVFSFSLYQGNSSSFCFMNPKLIVLLLLHLLFFQHVTGCHWKVVSKGEPWVVWQMDEWICSD